MLNEFAYGILRSLKSFLAETKRRVRLATSYYFSQVYKFYNSFIIKVLMAY